MTDALFNELLNKEVREIGAFYLNDIVTTPRDYLQVVSEGRLSTTITHEHRLDFDSQVDLPSYMRKLGARHAIKHDRISPTCLFIVQHQYALQIPDPPQLPVPTTKSVITVYGVTNDGRYNLAVLMLNKCIHGRITVQPETILHWEKTPQFTVDVLPYLEFFKTNAMLLEREVAA